MITLRTLSQATEQEVFDQVANHLLTQKKPSIDVNHSCLYRYGALKCAAGCLIGDDEYKPEMEELGSWDGLVDDGMAPSIHSDLIMELQNIHDSVIDWRLPEPMLEQFIKAILTKLATRFNLKPNF